MTITEIIFISLGLAMDAAAVSLAAAAGGYAGNFRAIFRLSFHFGLFQGVMPVIGWYVGVSLIAYIKHVDHWIAFFLLAFVGGRMIQEGLFPSPESQKNDPSRGVTMVMLSIATSIDALAIGLSLAVLDVGILVPCLLIGSITTLTCVLAIKVGARLGTLFGKRMEVAGGLVLVGIGIKVLIAHLFSG